MHPTRYIKFYTHTHLPEFRELKSPRKGNVYAFLTWFWFFGGVGLFGFLFCFGNRLSLGGPGYPRTHVVDQAGLKVSDPPASEPKCWN